MNHIPQLRHLVVALKSLSLPAYCAILTLCACAPDSDPRVSDTAPVVYQYSIEGMHCQSCADAITDKAMHIDGVVDCKVNLKDNSAMIAMRDATVQPQVKSGIEKLGYTVTMVPSAGANAAASPAANAVTSAAANAPLSSPATTSAPAAPK